MSIEYRYDDEKAILYVTMPNQATSEDFTSTLDKITNSEEDPCYISALWDLRNFDFSQVDTNFLVSIINIRKQNPQRGNPKIAFVVKGDYAFGMCRMFEILSQIENVPQFMSVYRDLSAGENWLLNKPETDDN